ncbi:ABC transporter ATP-binding protein [Vagococcus lutrae]|uniref:ABC transporter ATP-binding protein n=1 Tax=Vagococcus lutrae TaxID=81947 RepID=UPI00200E388D|nr:ABC transporter ATP-binding protein [Vagococcus lutrae]MDO5742240.1 ABC transporter ATP-binding protein [Vagococcus sp.]MDT2807565.1 ABC transporter ATP-binding protein [Vagococcus lutrae]MDY3705721.1 ABC transporter ATP-binding protein [Vagococcus lutrae]UQF11709.1 ABC transporter ATP-binding protein [Vagococcus lutrae]UQF23881.1 ABC transporter ATP-binding protein [Vagococcus lutrae]
MTHSDTIIEMNNVSVRYESNQNSVQAIEKVNMEIQKGEFVCLVGPSGCGKSTLLKTIAGYLQPTEGEVLMHGEAIQGPDWKRGVVFQSPTLYPWLTIEDNIRFGPTVRHLDEKIIEELTEKYLEEVGLADFSKNYPFELSGGMKQRVSLARVMINEPELMLMDEPFSALDAMTRKKMQDFLSDLWRKNHQTVLLITHDIEEALRLGTKVVVMSANPGRLVETFHPTFQEELLNNPTYHLDEDLSFIKMKREITEMIAK